MTEQGAAGGSPTTPPPSPQAQIDQLQETVQQLLRANLVLQGHVEQLTIAVNTQQAQHGSAGVLPPRPPPVLPPAKFKGDRQEFPAFKAQAMLYIRVREAEFGSPEAKVAFLISLLEGTARRWVTPMLVGNHPHLRDYDRFLEDMTNMFEDRQRKAANTRKLLQLQQGDGPLMDYVTEFCLLSQELGWNEEALLAHFKAGLQDDILDEMARVGPPSSLDAAIQLSAQIDERLQGRRRERRMAHRPPGKGEPLPFAPPRPVRASPSDPPAEEPMQLGAVRGPLTGAEKERRRRERLCLYCGKGGHFVRNCPAKSVASSRPVAGVGEGSGTNPQPQGNTNSQLW